MQPDSLALRGRLDYPARRLLLTVDLQMFSQEKTEQATPKKLQDARKKGEIAKSMELPGAFVLFSTFLFLLIFGGMLREQTFSLFTVSFTEYMLWDLTTENLMEMLKQLLYNMFILLAPFFLIAVVMAIVGNFIQFGLLLTGEPLKPKFSKIDPLKGAKRIFSIRAVIEFLKSVMKMVIIAAICYYTLSGELDNIVALSQLPIEQILRYTANLVLMLGLKIGAVLIGIALLDYMYQRYDFNKNQRMSKQDIKDEYKKSEGDPLIRGKIKEKQRQMAMRRMMQEVPNADVIVTNPTHYAIALKYDATQMDAPQVIAKGKDYVALKIKELAKQHDIVTMENRWLARTLYQQVEIGQNVPGELFQAVAEVLAYVYKLKKKS